MIKRLLEWLKIKPIAKPQPRTQVKRVVVKKTPVKKTTPIKGKK